MDDNWKDQTNKKLDKIIEHNASQDVYLAKLTAIAEINSKVLDEHKQASSRNGKRIELVENELVSHLSYVKGWLKALKWMAGTLVGVLSFVSLVLGIIYTIQKLG